MYWAYQALQAHSGAQFFLHEPTSDQSSSENPNSIVLLPLRACAPPSSPNVSATARSPQISQSLARSTASRLLLLSQISSRAARCSFIKSIPPHLRSPLTRAGDPTATTGHRFVEPRRCPPTAPLPNPRLLASACHSLERETGQPHRPPRPGAAASTHGRAGGAPPTARAARNAGPAGGCGRRERVRDRGSRRVPCARICAGDLPGGGCCTVWTMEHIHSCGRRAHRWRRPRSRMGRIDPLACPTARASRHAPSFNLHQVTRNEENKENDLGPAPLEEMAPAP
ncbi:hypothetical protein PVAP13_3KG274354 [Panicum virgatum]|uniref:Uncharacterized protein n=1 Tax=Panicum virgatum TaxID=38727 RepID=A0A8T0V1H7_PANVG|nr:hypothetical protein PVAP13_3KG274354 [Panicum virgatum]